jgi:hypothetical protein
MEFGHYRRDLYCLVLIFSFTKNLKNKFFNKNKYI